jgi:hypothetical protein
MSLIIIKGEGDTMFAIDQSHLLICRRQQTLFVLEASGGLSQCLKQRPFTTTKNNTQCSTPNRVTNRCPMTLAFIEALGVERMALDGAENIRD